MEITLSPEDNVRLANLCGALDENIKQIEDALEVKIARRGAHMRFSGDTHNMRLAVQLLENFYVRAKNPIGLDEIQLGLVEINKLKPEDIATSNAPVLMTRRTELHGRTPRQIAYLQQIQDHDITFGIGPAGTGKTYLAVASAVDAMSRDRVKRIILVRPAVEAGEKLGFLPGDLNQKVDPYLRPLYDALYDLAGYDTVNKMFERGAIEVAPLAYMRGRTLNQSFIILDEAQTLPLDLLRPCMAAIDELAKMKEVMDVAEFKDDLLGLSAIKEYFSRVYWQKEMGQNSELDKYSILETLKNSNIKNLPFDWMAQKFKMISTTMKTVIVPYDDAAKDYIEQLKNLSEWESVGQLARKLQVYTISVPQHLAGQLINSKLGALKYVQAQRFGDQFLVLESDNMYEENIGFNPQANPLLINGEDSVW